MLQFRLTAKVRKLFGFTDENLSDPVDGDAFLGNWYLNLCRIDGIQSLVFMSEKTFLSFVLLDVRPDHSEVMPNAFVNGLDHLLTEEKFADRSVHRLFAGVDIMEITKTTDRSVLAKLAAIEAMYQHSVERVGGLDNCDILDIMKHVNRSPDNMLEGLSPLKATKKLLRNNDERLH